MPRRRNNAPIVLFEEGNIEYESQPKEPIKPVKDFLKKKVWDLIKEKPDNNTFECSICLEEICCEKCYTLLDCGHSYHLCCVIKCKKCPLCRGE